MALDTANSRPVEARTDPGLDTHPTNHPPSPPTRGSCCLANCRILFAVFGCRDLLCFSPPRMVGVFSATARPREKSTPRVGCKRAPWVTIEVLYTWAVQAHAHSWPAGCPLAQMERFTILSGQVSGSFSLYHSRFSICTVYVQTEAR